MDPPFISSDSPPLRSTILGSFLGRGRPRNSSQSQANASSPSADPLRRETSPSPNPPSPGGQAAGSNSHRRGRPAGSAGPGNATTAVSAEVGNGVQPSTSAPGAGLAFSMLRRRRSAGTMANANNVNTAAVPASRPPTAPSATISNLRSVSNNASANRLPAPSNLPAHRLRLVPHLESRRSLRFDAITRDMRVGDPVLRIGRFTDRSGNNQNGAGGVNNSNPTSFKLAFKSKVVSRAHAELWVESSSPSLSTTSAPNVKFFIKDTKSSSGTFLNHVRLSPANTESRPFQIKDGDILQLGVDYQGGSEDIYKSVKIRVEIGREWQSGANKFNTNAIKNLKSLAQAVSQAGAGATSGHGKARSAGLPDCCICLFPIAINQALFISPCSHTFHFKCIRPMVEAHFPSWSCPLCRSFADLEEDVEVEAEMDFDVEEKDADADLELDAAVAGSATDLAPGAPIAEDEDSAVEELSDDPDLHAALAASRASANNSNSGLTNPFGNNANSSTHSNNPFLNMVNANGRSQNFSSSTREPRDGAETEVESDHVVGSTLRPARNQRRGHGRNLSAQLVDPIATEGMDEEQDEREFENDVEMLVDADLQAHPVADHIPVEAEATNHDEYMEFVDVVDVGRDAELEGRSSGSGMSAEGEAAVGAVGAKRKR